MDAEQAQEFMRIIDTLDPKWADDMGASCELFAQALKDQLVAMAVPPTSIAGIMSAAAKKAAEKNPAKPANAVTPRMPMFVEGEFKSSAGLDLKWKIECDAMTDADWACLAARVAERFSFQAVHGVPKGKPTGKDNGAAFANACRKHVTRDGDYFLIVDDVFTTGGSLERTREKTKRLMTHLPRIGVTAWNRSGQVPPQWIASIFTLWS